MITPVKNGFTLIEVVIFVAILSMFFVTGMAISTYSLRVMKTNESKIKATLYAEQLFNWIKVQKEIDWSDFVSMYTESDADGKTYCFNNTTISWPVPNTPGSCASFSLASQFKREVVLKNKGTPPNQVNVDIAVQWNEPGGIVSVPLHGTLSLWE